MKIRRVLWLSFCVLAGALTGRISADSGLMVVSSSASGSGVPFPLSIPAGNGVNTSIGLVGADNTAAGIFRVDNGTDATSQWVITSGDWIGTAIAFITLKDGNIQLASGVSAGNSSTLDIIGSGVNVSLTGIATFKVLGSAQIDGLTVFGDNIVPSITASTTLGTSLKVWQEVYTKALFGDNVNGLSLQNNAGSGIILTTPNGPTVLRAHAKDLSWDNSAITLDGVAFASLPASANGSILYCTDCNLLCTAGSSNGQICNRINGAWTH